MRDGRWLEKVNTICSTISALAALLALIIVLYPQIKPSNTNHIELANAGNVDSQMFLADHYYAVGDISQSIYWYSVASQTKGAHRATTINNLAYIYLTYDQFSRTKTDYYGNIARLFYTAAKGEKIKAAENLYIWLVSNPKELFGNQYEEFMEFAETTLKNDKDVSILRRRYQEDAEEKIEFYSRRLKSAMVSVSEPEENKKEKTGSKDHKQNIDALGRMLINLSDINEFYTWSQKQAKASFILAVVMCVLGFLLMCGAVVLPVAFSLELQMAIIPAVGGVITELVAGTALIVYKSSLKQLNHYHKALHEDERFLSSVNLLGKFSSLEVQDEMLKEIIRSEIQMNLLSLKIDEDTRT